MASCVSLHLSPASLTGRPRLRAAAATVATEATESAYENAKKEVTRRIKAHGKSGQIKKAVNELTDAARMGIPIDTQLATTLVGVCAQNKKMELAETLFDDLFRENHPTHVALRGAVGEYVEPDDVTFCSLIRGFGGMDDFSWDEISRIIERMKHEFSLKPTLNVYNALLEICAQRNDTVQAETFIDEMATENLQPDGLTRHVVRNRRAIRKLVKQLERELTSDEASI